MQIIYLNNRDILKEIHKSKLTYCSFKNPAKDSDFDLILRDSKYDPKPFWVKLDDIKKLSKSHIKQAKINRAERLNKLAGKDGPQISPESIKDTDIVFRVMTFEHIPLAPPKPPKLKAKAKILIDEIDSEDFEDDLPEELITVDPSHVKVNFPPFMHYRLGRTGKLKLVGKSHWKGDLKTGEFCRDHGNMTRELALMFMKLCERYGTRYNWRNYCVDTETEALTQRGWLGIDQINEDDTILSYENTKLVWSKIKSIYRGEYDGLMHHITSRSIDALVTPNHKFMTNRGLIEAELLKSNDKFIVMGDSVSAPIEKIYSDSFVELAGWIMTEGCYEYNEQNELKRICISQNPSKKADRIRSCLLTEQYKFSESGRKNLCFAIGRDASRKIASTFKTKNLNMDFILSLTTDQRELLINTMIDSDGWTRKGGNKSYCQKDKEHVDLFQALLTLAGHKSNYHYVIDHPSFGKLTNYYSINVFSPRGNQINVECLDFHGGFNNGNGINRANGKSNFPNIPTTLYKGMVWCPETEYGCFIARRNGKVYLTGNTYNDEMRSQALLQLSQIGLQFDESKSQNPFAYYTASITNSFVRILNIEKKNQNIRDDILEMNNLNPSYTRQGQGGRGSDSDDYE